MREIGVLIWVIFLIFGVIGSMVSSIRKQSAAGKEASVPPQWVPQTPQQPRPPAPTPLVLRFQSPAPASAAPQRLPAPPQRPPAPRVPPTPRPQPQPPPSRPESVHPAAPTPAPRTLRLFGNPHELVRAIVAAEVLGKPRAFRDEQL
jgi:hypothetical protein